jgi:hypothetical protein
VISPKSLALMRSPTVLTDGTGIDYGLGTRLGSLEGHRAFGHTGGGGGFSSILVEFPDDHVILAVLTNTEGPAIAIGRELAAAVLQLPGKRLLDLPVPAAEEAALTGTFDSDEGPIEQFVENHQVRFRIPGQQNSGGVLYRQSDNIYALPGGQEVHIIMRNGRVEWGLLYSCGLMMDAKYRTR